VITFTDVVDGVARRTAQTVVTGAATALIIAVGLPLWRPLLVAAALAGALSPRYESGVRRLGGRRSLAAALFTAATVILILIPVALLVIIAVREATQAVGLVRDTIASEGLRGLIAKAPDPIEGWLHRLVKLLPTEIDRAGSPFAAGGRWALGALSGALAVLAVFSIRLVLMLIALFFLLRDGPALLDWFVGATPLAPDRVREMMRQFRIVARSVLGANFITAAAQAAVATIGFAIARAPSPIFFGLLCLFSSLIPSVGTALVTFPVAGLMLLLGHPWSALFLAVWAAVVVGLIDNLLRPMLIRGEGQLHGALVFFSLIGAMSAFGGAGLFLGPLALAFFLAVMRTRRRERETPASGEMRLGG
jgi:predicted PurR-regulated permease PerM